MKDLPRVVIIGAGFGGLFAARSLAGKPVEVLLIDANNYHVFKPLLYQVATSALDPSEIAYPVRTIFRSSKNVRFLMGQVRSIDAVNKTVEVQMESRITSAQHSAQHQVSVKEVYQIRQHLLEAVVRFLEVLLI